jgi:predicted dehydrogenase
MGIQRSEVEVEKDEPLKLELAAFIASVACGEDPAVTGQQGTAALELALEITRIIRAQW